MRSYSRPLSPSCLDENSCQFRDGCLDLCSMDIQFASGVLCLGRRRAPAKGVIPHEINELYDGKLKIIEGRRKRYFCALFLERVSRKTKKVGPTVLGIEPRSLDFGSRLYQLS